MSSMTPRARLLIAEAEYAALLRIARPRTRSDDDAREAVQEALVQLGEADVQDPDGVLPWVRKALPHICADLYRQPSARRRAKAHSPSDYLVADVADDVCHRAECVWLRRLI